MAEARNERHRGDVSAGVLERWQNCVRVVIANH